MAERGSPPTSVGSADSLEVKEPREAGSDDQVWQDFAAKAAEVRVAQVAAAGRAAVESQPSRLPTASAPPTRPGQLPQRKPRQKHGSYMAMHSKRLALSQAPLRLKPVCDSGVSQSETQNPLPTPLPTEEETGAEVLDEGEYESVADAFFSAITPKDRTARDPGAPPPAVPGAEVPGQDSDRQAPASKRRQAQRVRAPLHPQGASASQVWRQAHSSRAVSLPSPATQRRRRAATKAVSFSLPYLAPASDPDLTLAVPSVTVPPQLRDSPGVSGSARVPRPRAATPSTSTVPATTGPKRHERRGATKARRRQQSSSSKVPRTGGSQTSRAPAAARRGRGLPSPDTQPRDPDRPPPRKPQAIAHRRGSLAQRAARLACHAARLSMQRQHSEQASLAELHAVPHRPLPLPQARHKWVPVEELVAAQTTAHAPAPAPHKPRWPTPFIASSPLLPQGATLSCGSVTDALVDTLRLGFERFYWQGSEVHRDPQVGFAKWQQLVQSLSSQWRAWHLHALVLVEGNAAAAVRAESAALLATSMRQRADLAHQRAVASARSATPSSQSPPRTPSSPSSSLALAFRSVERTPDACSEGNEAWLAPSRHGNPPGAPHPRVLAVAPGSSKGTGDGNAPDADFNGSEFAVAVMNSALRRQRLSTAWQLLKAPLAARRRREALVVDGLARGQAAALLLQGWCALRAVHTEAVARRVAADNHRVAALVRKAHTFTETWHAFMLRQRRRRFLSRAAGALASHRAVEKAFRGWAGCTRALPALKAALQLAAQHHNTRQAHATFRAWHALASKAATTRQRLSEARSRLLARGAGESHPGQAPQRTPRTSFTSTAHVMSNFRAKHHASEQISAFRAAWTSGSLRMLPSWTSCGLTCAFFFAVWRAKAEHEVRALQRENSAVAGSRSVENASRQALLPARLWDSVERLPPQVALGLSGAQAPSAAARKRVKQSAWREVHARILLHLACAAVPEGLDERRRAEPRSWAAELPLSQLSPILADAPGTVSSTPSMPMPPFADELLGDKVQRVPAGAAGRPHGLLAGTHPEDSLLRGQPTELFVPGGGREEADLVWGISERAAHGRSGKHVRDVPRHGGQSALKAPGSRAEPAQGSVESAQSDAAGASRPASAPDPVRRRATLARNSSNTQSSWSSMSDSDSESDGSAVSFVRGIFALRLLRLCFEGLKDHARRERLVATATVRRHRSVLVACFTALKVASNNACQLNQRALARGSLSRQRRCFLAWQVAAQWSAASRRSTEAHHIGRLRCRRVLRGLKRAAGEYNLVRRLRRQLSLGSLRRALHGWHQVVGSAAAHVHAKQRHVQALQATWATRRASDAMGHWARRARERSLLRRVVERGLQMHRAALASFPSAGMQEYESQALHFRAWAQVSESLRAQRKEQAALYAAAVFLRGKRLGAAFLAWKGVPKHRVLASRTKAQQTLSSTFAAWRSVTETLLCTAGQVHERIVRPARARTCLRVWSALTLRRQSARTLRERCLGRAAKESLRAWCVLTITRRRVQPLQWHRRQVLAKNMAAWREESKVRRFAAQRSLSRCFTLLAKWVELAYAQRQRTAASQAIAAARLRRVLQRWSCAASRRRASHSSKPSAGKARLEAPRQALSMGGPPLARQEQHCSPPSRNTAAGGLSRDSDRSGTPSPLPVPTRSPPPAMYVPVTSFERKPFADIAAKLSQLESRATAAMPGPDVAALERLVRKSSPGQPPWVPPGIAPHRPQRTAAPRESPIVRLVPEGAPAEPSVIGVRLSDRAVQGDPLRGLQLPRAPLHPRPRAGQATLRFGHDPCLLPLSQAEFEDLAARLSTRHTR